MIGLSAACLAYYGLTATQANENAGREYVARALAIAEAGASAATRAIAEGGDGTVAETDFGGGTYEVTSTDNGDNTYTLVTTGTYQGITRILQTDISVASLSVSVRGAITSRANVTTLGNLTVDGRDYSAAGVLVGAGTYGISTPGTYTRSGNSKTGGKGIAPAKPVPAGTTETSGPPPYPTTPEEVLGLSAGALDSLATSTAPTFPMNGGIYYYTGNLQAASISGSGILIVHNTAGNALLKNLNGSGTFKGLIIADDIEHIHNNILGAVVHLSATASGNCIGNGSGTVKYSSEVLSNLSLSGVDGMDPTRDSWIDVTFSDE